VFGFVYIWYDKKHTRYYIGSHKGHLDDGYISSSTWMKNAYKRRPLDFRRKLLSIIMTNKEDLLQEEQKWLNFIKDDELGKKYYNLKKKAAGGFSKCAIQKSIESRKGKSLPLEWKQNQSKALKDKSWTDKRRESQVGSYTKRLTYEHNGVIIGNIDQAIEYSGKSRKTIDRWCTENSSYSKKEWRKYYES
jgi:hypothetical protein